MGERAEGEIARRLIVTRVELVDLTLLDTATNETIKEATRPFKVLLSYNEKKGTLRIHFLPDVRYITDNYDAHATM